MILLDTKKHCGNETIMQLIIFQHFTHFVQAYDYLAQESEFSQVRVHYCAILFQHQTQHSSNFQIYTLSTYINAAKLCHTYYSWIVPHCCYVAQNSKLILSVYQCHFFSAIISIQLCSCCCDFLLLYMLLSICDTVTFT